MFLYLDFDGVLHPHAVYKMRGHGIVLKTDELELPPENNLDSLALFCYAHFLEDILADYPAVQIILATSWVESIGFNMTRARLPASLQGRVIGSTYHSRHTPDWYYQSRFQQIRQNVGYRRLLDREWVALDDDATDWPATSRGQLIHCEENLGLAEPRVRAELRAALDQRCAVGT